MSTGTEWADWSDDELLAELGKAVAESDVSERRREAARAAFTWRSVDAELAELLHDSALDAGAAVRTNGETTRTLSFRSGALELEIEVDGDVVRGQVIGAETGSAPSVVLQRTDAFERAAEVDASGFFRFADVEAGPVRFVARAGASTLTSPWVVL